MRTLKEYIDKYKDVITTLLKDRLYSSGTFPNGDKIRTYKAAQGEVYSPFTLMLKKEKGEPTDRVTSFDTGDLYQSFSTATGGDSFAIEYNDSKPNGKVSDNIDTERAYSLGELEISQLQGLITIDIQNDFAKEARESILLGLK